MGLDITYCTDAKRLRDHSDDGDYDFAGGELSVNVSPDFPSRADGLKDGIYSAENISEFRAGSYGGYNDWRETLAKIAGYPALTDRGDRHLHSSGAWHASSGPFWELINFTDCDGVIGHTTAAKLARDFADFQAVADNIDDEYWRMKYDEWRAAFETASLGGFVLFH